MKKGNFQDLTGKTFGKWTVLGEREVVKTKSGWAVSTWLCRCECGTEKRVQTSNFKNFNSCGCLRNELTRKRMSKPKGVAATNKILSYYEKNAARRNIKWNLSKEQFIELIQGSCAYCGIVGSKKTYKHKDFVCHNGIDRVDSTKGYNIENCVSCCSTCNLAKFTLSLEEFKKWIERIVLKWGNPR